MEFEGGVVRSHIDAIYALLPKGKVWPLEPGDAPSLDGLLDATAQEFDRVQGDADALLADFFPDDAVASLPDWERILGLTSAGLSTEQRQAQILSQLRRRADPTLANITIIAQSWGPGIVVTDKQYRQLKYGAAVYGDRYYGEIWLTAINIYYPGLYSAEFEATMVASVPLHCTIIFTHD